ncbi:MAG: RNA 2',3'-cyclic phosphodiesterase [Spirochaetes bacterium]|nr:MAG: RNA 2',3'-cyclic phosphodiesterase [Spirochaetota bacterium]
MNRLFIALPVNGEIRAALQPSYEFLRGYENFLKPVAPANFHITVKFLGECEGNVATAIESTFLEITAPQAEIPFSISGIGVFPDMKKPNVIWAGLKTDADALAQVFKNVEKYVANFRFKEEKREFIPHLTIARMKSGRKIAGELLKFVEKNGATEFGSSAFDRLTLYSSKLTPDGPIYTALKSIKF